MALEQDLQLPVELPKPAGSSYLTELLAELYENNEAIHNLQLELTKEPLPLAETVAADATFILPLYLKVADGALPTEYSLVRGKVLDVVERLDYALPLAADFLSARFTKAYADLQSAFGSSLDVAVSRQAELTALWSQYEAVSRLAAKRAVAIRPAPAAFSEHARKRVFLRNVAKEVEQLVKLYQSADSVEALHNAVKRVKPDTRTGLLWRSALAEQCKQADYAEGFVTLRVLAQELSAAKHHPQALLAEKHSLADRVDFLSEIDGSLENRYGLSQKQLCELVAYELLSGKPQKSSLFAGHCADALNALSDRISFKASALLGNAWKTLEQQYAVVSVHSVDRPVTLDEIPSHLPLLEERIGVLERTAAALRVMTNPMKGRSSATMTLENCDRLNAQLEEQASYFRSVSSAGEELAIEIALLQAGAPTCSDPLRFKHFGADPYLKRLVVEHASLAAKSAATAGLTDAGFSFSDYLRTECFRPASAQQQVLLGVLDGDYEREFPRRLTRLAFELEKQAPSCAADVDYVRKLGRGIELAARAGPTAKELARSGDKTAVTGVFHAISAYMGRY